MKNTPHLWRRRYLTANGEQREKYYARFTCKLKGKRRYEPLGSNHDAAKIELKRILADDVNGEDFDAAKQPQKQGLMFREWAEDYFKNKIDPRRKAGGIEREKRSYKPLAAFFGDMLTDIKRSVIMQYRNKRLQEPVMRRGKVVMVNGKPPMCLLFPNCKPS